MTSRCSPSRLALIALFAATLASCSAGSGHFTPAAPPNGDAAGLNERARTLRIPSLAAIGAPVPVQSDDAPSRMARVSSRQPLLYVSDAYRNRVQVYDYPTGQHVGTLTGFRDPQGECVDTSGNVYVANLQRADVLVFHHGAGSPFKTLQDPGEYPGDCAVNANGRVVVSNIYGTNGGPGSISIYDNGATSPTHVYYPSVGSVYFVGYNGSGTLFLDAIDDLNNVSFAKMTPSGHFTVIPITGGTISFPGAVKEGPGGAYMAVGDQSESGTIYHVSEAGAILGKTTLDKACDVVQFTIRNGKVVAPNVCDSLANTKLYPYPAGGSPILTLTGFQEPIGSAISSQ